MEQIKLTLKNIEIYWHFVQDLNVQKIIEEHPTPFYQKEVEGGRINWAKVIKTKNPIYSATLFDCISWWKMVRLNRWRELRGIALIVLGKPHHDGYQERVFSRGTYTDDFLRKRMREDTFEINVLQSLNLKTIKIYSKVIMQKSTQECA
jgi:hypothetical protein